MAKEFATYEDYASNAEQDARGLRVSSDEQALRGRGKEDPLAELARIIGGTDSYRDSLRQNNHFSDEPRAAANDPVVHEAETDNWMPPLPVRSEPAVAAADFHEPHWEAPAPVATSKELQWDDLEAELASFAARPLPAAAVKPPVAPLQTQDDLWRHFEEPSLTYDQRAEAREAAAYAPSEAAYAPLDSQWNDDTGRVSHALTGERDSDPYYNSASHLPEPDAAFEEAAPARHRRSGLMTIAVVVGVALLGGASVAAYRMAGGTSSGDARVVKADPAPVKVAAPAAVENAKRVQDRVPGGAEQVVSREEQPLSMREQAAQVQAPALPSGPRVISLSAAREEAAEAARETAIAAAPAIPAFAPPAVAAPTVSPAPATTLPVTASAPVPRPAAADEPRRVRTMAVGPDGNVRQSAQPTADAPISLAPAAIAARPAQVAARPTPAAAPAAAPVAPVGGGSGNFVVQITSQRSDADARAAFSSIQRRQPALAGYSPNIKSVELGDRGTYYRVRVGPMGRDGANDLCQKLKSGGNDCIVQPN